MLFEKYKDIREHLKVGDLVAFSGTGAASRIIMMATHSDISHVGAVLQMSLAGEPHIQIMESTSLGDGIAGVKMRRLSEVVESYDGKIYIFPLKKDIWKKMSRYDYACFLLSMKGKEYDTPQAILSALDLLPDSTENFDKLFCSELICGAYEAGGVLKNVNASEETPADLVSRNLYDEEIEIIK